MNMSFLNQIQKLLGEKQTGIKINSLHFKHNKLGTWDSPEWEEVIRPAMTDEKTRCDYD